MIHITHHAITRYLERVDPRATDEQIRAALTSAAVQLAAQQNCQCSVKLPGGQRIVVKDGAVITVKPPIFKRKVMRGKPDV